MPTLTADDIIRVLADKHKEDVFIPECKTGPSDKGMMRMDAWVMAKSWAHPMSTVYEVKVNRNDFLKDNKWPGYLPYCNALYFVCPAELIAKEEVPAGVGLMWVSKTGTVVYTKIKAAYRKVEIPEAVYRYILMNRAQITREQLGDRRQYWEQWLTDKKLDYAFGHRVSKAINELIKEKIEGAERRNSDLSRQIDRYRDVKALLNNLGFDEGDTRLYSFHDRLTKKLQEIKIGVGQDLVDVLEHTQTNLETALRILKKPDLAVKADDATVWS